uniref:hypothetical protein n=1 Tax=Petrachloros mirabilis TaxID=2918835 RepID=UPI001EE9994B|nr:hypothetical protein [Petrachloros mirabilis]
MPKRPAVLGLRRSVRQGWLASKFYIYLALLGAILAFFGHALYDHWQEVSAIPMSWASWACLVSATGVTLLAHIWTGWVWGWILRDLNQPVSSAWAAQAYLITNLAKYLPSNLVHLYGRILAATRIGVPFGAASLSVLLDTMLMAAGGLVLGLLSVPAGGLLAAGSSLLAILVLIHPSILGGILQRLPQQSSPQGQVDSRVYLVRYPLLPLLGEIGFVGLKGLGFVMIVAALAPVPWSLVPELISIFSIGWLLGFITPGLPGGLGIFEVTVTTLLSQQLLLSGNENFSIGVAISAVALHRLSTILAEALGAALAWLDQQVAGLPPVPSLKTAQAPPSRPISR